MRDGKFSRKAIVFLTVVLFAAPLAALSIQPGSVVVCDAIDKSHIFEVFGGIFNGLSGGSIASKVGEDFETSNGLPATELIVLGFTDSGHAEGLGNFSFNLDTSRPAGQSWVQDNGDGTLTQVMNLNLVANIEALGNKPLYTSKPATVAANLETFPQTGAVYHLLGSVDLVDEQGKVQATVHEVTVVMSSTKVY